MIFMRTFNLLLACAVVAALADRLMADLPAPPPPPPMPVTRAQRDQDVKSFRDWWYPCAKPPGGDVVVRIKAWADAHPDDGEALFFVWASYRYHLTWDAVITPNVKDVELAAVIKRAAELGCIPAMARRAMILIGSRRVERSGEALQVEKGVKMLEECIQKGDPDAFLFKAGLVGEGDAGFKRDVVGAERLAEKAAELGCLRAWAYLGLMQTQTIDELTGIGTIRKGAEAGDPYAQLLLAKYLFKKACSKTELAEAFRWVKESAERQWVEAEAPVMLADCYVSGKGTKANRQLAVRWYKVGGLLGDRWAALQVCFALLKGDGCEMNVKSGLQGLEELAEIGYGPAETFLGNLYLEGLLVPRDVARAKKLLEAAADDEDETGELYLKMLMNAKAADFK
jgi:TPR repeat protein